MPFRFLLQAFVPDSHKSWMSLQGASGGKEDSVGGGGEEKRGIKVTCWRLQSMTLNNKYLNKQNLDEQHICVSRFIRVKPFVCTYVPGVNYIMSKVFQQQRQH